MWMTKLLVGAARVRVLQDLRKAPQRLQRVAFGRGMVVNRAIQGDIMPRSRRFLPELAGRGPHLVRPVGGLVEAFAAPENLFDIGAGKPAELRVGDRGHHPVTGLAPRQGG